MAEYKETSQASGRRQPGETDGGPAKRRRRKDPAALTAVPSVFLTADWNNLLFFNYDVDPRVLRPLTPPGTELDLLNGHAICSLVAFTFSNTRILGGVIPGHRDFLETNLRFYVRRHTPLGPRRGVAFVRELVPRLAIATLARLLYGEPYRALAMDHRKWHDVRPTERRTHVLYACRGRRAAMTMQATALTGNPPQVPGPGSDETFLIDHAYGYGRHLGKPMEYVVEHPPWRLWPVVNPDLQVDNPTIANLYGPAFVPFLAQTPPRSAFFAEGSAIKVRYPRRFKARA